jgi:hypothetical protein
MRRRKQHLQHLNLNIFIADDDDLAAEGRAGHRLMHSSEGMDPDSHATNYEF